MKKSIVFTCLLAVLFWALPNVLWTQGAALPLGNPAYHTVLRQEILSGQTPEFHTGLRYFLREDVFRYALALDTAQAGLSTLDRADLDYIFRDNNEWVLDYGLDSSYYHRSKHPVLKYFYRTPANWFEVDVPNFRMRVNPVLNLKYGPLRDDPSPYFINQRGVELRGSFDNKIHFYSNIVESQANFPDYLRRFIETQRSLPGNGFYKRGYTSELLDFNRGYDFLNSQAYLAFSLTEHVGAQFGYGRNTIGTGFRSVLLSDFSNNYLYLKLNWRVWKLHFQNIFAELKSTSAQRVGGSQLVPKKYMAAHYLSFQVTPQMEIGLYEAVIFNRSEQFELQYLNPVILYRTIEQSVGSPDNVLIGANFKWNIARRLQLYGQFILDEFKFDELFVDPQGWWGNKFALQAGVHLPNLLGIDHLDAQLEYNTARPYTYMHFDSLSNYTHYDLPLAHPLGANFREWIATLRYQPHPRVVLDGRVLRMEYGADIAGANYGRDWKASYQSRVQDYGNEIGQGEAAEVMILGLDLSYQFRHNIFLDLHYFFRRQETVATGDRRDNSFLSAGLRMNIANYRADF